MLDWLLRTDDSLSHLILRLTLGIVFFAHGAQKMLGWFGGYGFSGTMQFFTQQMGIPAVFAFLAIMAEFLGSLALILGFGTRVAALGVAIVMVVAMVTTHLQHGFFMNWFGNQKGEGFEFHVLVIAIAVVLGLKGAGPYSVDGLMVRGK